MKIMRLRPNEAGVIVLDSGSGREKVYPVETSWKKFSAQLGKPLSSLARLMENWKNRK